jgi:cytochrome P450
MFGTKHDNNIIFPPLKLISVRAILHDEHTYPDPLKFHPERFEDPEKNKLAGINEYPSAFGFGRRWVLDLSN